MLEVDRSDALVNAAARRLQGLDSFSRSAPIGRAELATIVLQGLAELGAHAEWTVTPAITDSILHLLSEEERKRYEEFEASVRRAAQKAGPAEAQSSSMGPSLRAAPWRSIRDPRASRGTATLEEIADDEELGARAAEAVVYHLYHEIVERAVLLVEHSASAREHLWPLVRVVAALIPPPDLSLHRPLGGLDGSGA